MTDASGAVTLTSAYTPWGDTLATSGSGNFSTGYFGGMTPVRASGAGVDTATGLLYVGNGQYYDPETGRFLSRDAKPDQTNPYIPWNGNPSSALIGPLALLALVFGRKKTRSKWDNIVIIAVLCLAVEMSLTGCGGGTTTIKSGDAIATITQIETPEPTQIPSYAVTVTTPTQTATLTLVPVASPGDSCWADKKLQHSDLVAARIYFEGASSMAGDKVDENSQQLFTWMTFALKSLRDYDSSAQPTPYFQYTEWNYGGRQIISAANPDNPNNPYGSCLANPTTFLNCGYRAPDWAVNLAEEILSAPGCGDSPFANAGESVHWISPTTFPRYDLPGLYKVPIKGCDAGCQMNDIRRLNYMRGYADKASSVKLEEFKSFTLSSTNTEECYWRGLYFVKNSDWNAVTKPEVYQKNEYHSFDPKDSAYISDYANGAFKCSHYPNTE